MGGEEEAEAGLEEAALRAELGAWLMGLPLEEGPEPREMGMIELCVAGPTG